MQLCELYQNINNALSKGNIPESDVETRVILREALHLSAADICGHPEREISQDEKKIIDEIIQRRLVREPLQYILGKWNFMGLDLFVEEGVLIPRPDTEILVETGLKYLHDSMRVLDLCTGTGCILISLMHYSNDCTGTGVDISQKAIDLANRNAKAVFSDKLNEEELGAKIKFVLADLYAGAEGKYDLIVSNPPYIASEVIETLEPEVRDYEPRLALDGGIDGFDLVGQIIDGANEYLVPGGSLMLEIGYDQGQRTCEYMEKAGFICVECIKDYAGLDRVVVGTKSILEKRL